MHNLNLHLTMSDLKMTNSSLNQLNLDWSKAKNELDANRLDLLITTPANDEEIITVIGEGNIYKKLTYILNTYNALLQHKHAPNVRIISYKFTKSSCKNTKDKFDQIA